MRNRWLIAGVVLLVASICANAKTDVAPKGPEEDGTKAALVKIAGEGTMDSHAFEYLTELSDEIGGRVTGTPAAQKAVDWGVGKMKAIGLQNVRAEKWTMWKGWTRGTAEAGLISPVRHIDCRCDGLDGFDAGGRCRGRSGHRKFVQPG